jgi:hypothetical protein
MTNCLAGMTIFGGPLAQTFGNQPYHNLPGHDFIPLEPRTICCISGGGNDGGGGPEDPEGGKADDHFQSAVKLLREIKGGHSTTENATEKAPIAQAPASRSKDEFERHRRLLEEQGHPLMSVYKKKESELDRREYLFQCILILRQQQEFEEGRKDRPSFSPDQFQEIAFALWCLIYHFSDRQDYQLRDAVRIFKQHYAETHDRVLLDQGLKALEVARQSEDPLLRDLAERYYDFLKSQYDRLVNQ